MSRKRSRAKSPRLFPLVRQTLTDTLLLVRHFPRYQISKNKQNRSDLSIKNRSLLLRKDRETPSLLSKGLQSVSLIQYKDKVCKDRKEQRKMVFKSGKLSSHKPREHTLKSLVRC